MPNYESKKGFLPNVAIGDIEPNSDQPRTAIPPESLIGLADSIRSQGIIEPLIVTKRADSSKFVLVAGERRWRAAKLAQLKSVPVLVRELSGREILELALVENIQREDLNSLEEARALDTLHKDHELKLEEIAQRIGRDISTVSNKLRLLKLPERIQQGILGNNITESHAYQLLTLKSSDAQLAAYQIVIAKELSVAKTEELVREIRQSSGSAEFAVKKAVASLSLPTELKDLEQKLSKKFGRGFKIAPRKYGGVVTIPFKNTEQVEELFNLLESAKKLGKST